MKWTSRKFLYLSLILFIALVAAIAITANNPHSVAAIIILSIFGFSWFISLFCACYKHKVAVRNTSINANDKPAITSPSILIQNPLAVAVPSKFLYAPSPSIQTQVIEPTAPPSYFQNSNNASKRIFISYCWKNSKQAEPLCIGIIDPRDITKRIEQVLHEKCWLDVDVTNSGHALYEAITIGINQAEVVIICISDEYAISESCILELNYARIKCKKPIIVIVVGESMKWEQAVSCGVLLSKDEYIDFRDPIKFNSNMTTLIGRLMKILSSKSAQTK